MRSGSIGFHARTHVRLCVTGTGDRPRVQAKAALIYFAVLVKLACASNLTVAHTPQHEDDKPRALLRKTYADFMKAVSKSLNVNEYVQIGEGLQVGE